MQYCILIRIPEVGLSTLCKLIGANAEWSSRKISKIMLFFDWMFAFTRSEDKREQN